MQMLTLLKKLSYTAAMLSVVSSCSTRIQENQLDTYSRSYALLMLCESYIEPQFFSQVNELLGYALNTWSYDSDALNRGITGHFLSIDSNLLNENYCRTETNQMYSSLSANLRQHLQQKEIEKQRAIASMSQSLQRMGNSISNAGNQALQNTSSNMIQPQFTPTYVQPNVSYETTPNPMNNVSGQTLIGSDTSASGRKVCKYSGGATTVLPFGSVTCPIIYGQ